MKRLMVVMAAAALAGCCGLKTDGDPKALGGARDSGTTFMADALKPYVESGNLPGEVVILYKDGVQETTCAGYADWEAKRPITVDDPYMQCSQTKGFCGVTAAILIEEGKLGLDDPISKYLPEFKDLVWVFDGETNGIRRLRRPKNEITLRMCLNHTAGFGFEVQAKAQEIRGGGWSGGMPIRSVAATAATGFPLNFEPGTKVQYSNTGIDVAAAVVEVVSGMKWEKFLKERVLDPLGMTSSGFWPTDEQLARKVEMYDCQKDQPAKWRAYADWMQRPYNDDRVFSSAGAGLWTTAADQLKFYKMLMNLGLGENGVRILKEETVKSILATSTRAATLSDPNYSLGLRAPIKDNENEWFGHGGAWGTNCMVNWHKKQLKLWAVQLPGGPRPWDKAREAAANAFFDAKLDNSGEKAYTGRMK